MVNNIDLKIVVSAAWFSSFSQLLIYLNFLLTFNFICVNEINLSQKRKEWLFCISIHYLTFVCLRMYLFSRKKKKRNPFLSTLNFTEVIRFGDWTTHSICPKNALFMKLQLCQLMAVFLASNIFYFYKFYRAFDQTAQLSAQSTGEYAIGVPQGGNYLLDTWHEGEATVHSLVWMLFIKMRVTWEKYFVIIFATSVSLTIVHTYIYIYI